MAISVFDLFSIGIGPSSSHTVGPMRAARGFLHDLKEKSKLTKTKRVVIDLYGSLALTGKGHGTDKAILNGLEGYTPEAVDPELILPNFQRITDKKRIRLNSEIDIDFNLETDLLFHQQEVLPHHTNGMRFTAYDESQKKLHSIVFYSIGGGFIVTEEDFGKTPDDTHTPYYFTTGAELFAICKRENLPVWKIMLENEKAWLPEKEVKARLLKIAKAMEDCIQRGLHTHGELPGILHVKRRAPLFYQKIKDQDIAHLEKPADFMLWVDIFAMAVNEENAAGGRVVTAPTNGAAGIIPAVLEYYKRFIKGANEDGIMQFLLTAGAIAILYKLKASISGAEVGCQGEVGTASSMAAGALTAVMGGTLGQIENAAEIAMEHHLGMTCDPIAGLVQIPCIERNAMGAVKAVNATQLALLEEGTNKVSLDKVIKTMFETGKDMMSKYKETSLGGLAVNVTEC